MPFFGSVLCVDSGSSPHFELSPGKQSGSSLKVWWNLVLGHTRSRITTRSNLASEHTRFLVLVSKPMFFGMGNHLRPFSEASDWPDAQEQALGAVGGQGALPGVTQLLSMLETWFWCQNPCFWVWAIIWDHFQRPHVDLEVKNRVYNL